MLVFGIMNSQSLITALEQKRDFVFQIVFMSLFVFAVPLFVDDVRSVMNYHTQSIPLGIIGLFVIVADSIGLVIKSKELRTYHSYSREKAINRFFVIFWIFRASVVMIGVMVCGIALTGNDIHEDNGFVMGIFIFEAMRWLVMGFVSNFIISGRKQYNLTKLTVFIGDSLILLSSLYYLCVFWLGMQPNMTSWKNLTTAELAGEITAGFLLFLMIYVPSSFFQFLEAFMKSKDRQAKIRFWLGILITGIMALLLPRI